MIVVPTLHPAALLRGEDASGMAKFRETVIGDFSKALRLRHRAPAWDERVIWEKDISGRYVNLFPTVEEVAEFCRRVWQTRITIDVETSGEEPLNSRLICIGIGSENGRAMCVPLLKQGGERYWTHGDEVRVRELLRFLFIDRDTPKNFHNGAFDTIILQINGLPVNDLLDPWAEDTMAAKHCVDGELPNGLAFCASTRLEVPYWKDDVKGDVRWLDLPDIILRAYNLRDVLSTDRLVEPFRAELRKHKLEGLYKEEIAASAIMAGGTLRGMEVDVERRDSTEIDNRQTLPVKDKAGTILRHDPNPEYGRPMGLGPKLRLDKAAALARLQAVAEWVDFNPRSQNHLRGLLFEKLKFPIVKRTDKSGAPSTDKNAMVLLALHAQTPEQINALEALIKFRKADKMLGTWVEGLPVLGDGRVHASWKLLTTTGRFASSPNMQNFNAWIKRIFKAAAGHKLVSIDLSQAELRVMALLAGDELLIRMYAENLNVHTINACMLFQIKPPPGHDDMNPQTEAFLIEMCPQLLGESLRYEKFRTVPDKTRWKSFRTLAKNFVFGDNYGAEATTLYEVIRSKRDPVTDELLFKDVDLGKIEALKLLWEQMHHWIPSWWKKITDTVVKQGYYRSPISDRIRWFRGGFKRNEILNCLDAATEALTARGWVPGFELRRDDVLLTKNAATGVLEWQQMTDLRLFPDHEGDVFEFRSKSFSAISTPGHRWLVDTSWRQSVCVTSENMTESVYKIHRTGIYGGPERKTLSDDFVELAGWFLTDGHYRLLPRAKSPGRPFVRLYQSQRANPENVERIDALIARLGLKVCRCGPQKRTEMITWDLPAEHAQMLHERFPTRELTHEFLLQLTAAQAQILIETMWLGDGSRDTNKFSFYSRSYEAASAFQTLCVMCSCSSALIHRPPPKVPGRSSKLLNNPKATSIYVVNIHRRKVAHVLPENRRRYHAKIPVWCPIVPNTYFVARREGQVFITGNTPIQEFVAGRMNKLLIEIAKYQRQTMGYETMVTSQVHDALTSEVPEHHVKLTQEIYDWTANQPFEVQGFGTFALPADKATVGVYLDEV